MKRIAAASFVLPMLIVMLPSVAHATFSVVAAEPETGRLGGAGVSCVGDFSVTIIYGSVPGKGAVHAQAELSRSTRLEAISLLSRGTAPEAIIAAITDPTFDKNAGVRQYGIVDLQSRVAGYTGPETIPYAAHRNGSISGITYSLQGNILTGAAVLDQMQEAFVEGCDLPDRLMRAVEAGGVGGEGDARCTPSGISADSGFIRVEASDGERLIHLDFVDTAPTDPLTLLRQGYDQWRKSHPCPEPAPDGDDDGAAEGAAPPAQAAPANEGAGCGCGVPSRNQRTGAWVLLLLGVGCRLWRRSHPFASR